MKRVQLSLSAYCGQNTFPLIECARRKVYEKGQPTDDEVSVYTALIKYQPIEIRIGDDGKSIDAAEVIKRVEAGNPIQVSFENCILTVLPVSEYAIKMGGTADKVIVVNTPAAKA